MRTGTLIVVACCVFLACEDSANDGTAVAEPTQQTVLVGFTFLKFGTDDSLSPCVVYADSVYLLQLVPQQTIENVKVRDGAPMMAKWSNYTISQFGFRITRRDTACAGLHWQIY